MIDNKKEPEITYGTTFQRHLTRVWNSRISYPNKDLLLIDDDAKGAFRHTKYHPNIVSAFSFQLLDLMYVPIRGNFWSISSPSNFEPLARSRVWLAKHISRDDTLVKNHWNIIKPLNISKRPDKK